MNEHDYIAEACVRLQIDQRVAGAREARLANHLPGVRRHRLGLGLRRHDERPDN